MYCCTPGTWVQPIFATASAVTMALLTVEESAAVQLRIFYLFMAVALVMVVNKFCFPSKKEVRRMIEQGAVKMDSQKITDVFARISRKPGQSAVLQSGKRTFFKIVF